jgi:hypothetical protein
MARRTGRGTRATRPRRKISGKSASKARAKDLRVVVRLLGLLSPNQAVPRCCRRGEAQRAGVHALDRRTAERAAAPEEPPHHPC